MDNCNLIRCLNDKREGDKGMKGIRNVMSWRRNVNGTNYTATTTDINMGLRLLSASLVTSSSIP